MTPSARALVVVTVALALAPLALPPFFLQLLTEIAIVGLFATAFNLLMGFGGMVSFGHAAYFALGAYAAALLVKRAGVPMLLALPAAPLAAAGGALLFGFFIVRLTHTYFAMLSLAFAQIVFTVIFKWKSLTGGDDGLLDVWPPAGLKSPAAYYYFTLATVALSLVALRAVSESPFGYALKSVRENPRRARFIGINVRRLQLFAFVISRGWPAGCSPFITGAFFPTLPTSPSRSSHSSWRCSAARSRSSDRWPAPSASRSSSGSSAASGPCTGRSSWGRSSLWSSWRCRSASWGSREGGGGGPD